MHEVAVPLCHLLWGPQTCTHHLRGQEELAGTAQGTTSLPKSSSVTRNGSVQGKLSSSWYPQPRILQVGALLQLGNAALGPDLQRHRTVTAEAQYGGKNISYVLLNSAICKAGIISSLKCFDTRGPNNHDKSYQAYAQILEVTDDKQSSDKTLYHAGNHWVNGRIIASEIHSSPIVGNIPIYQSQMNINCCSLVSFRAAVTFIEF